MAEYMKGMVRMTKPHKSDTNINGKAVLGGEPAERVQRIGKGNETEYDGQFQLQQTTFYCKENHQHIENTNKNVPSAHGLPLGGSGQYV